MAFFNWIKSRTRAGTPIHCFTMLFHCYNLIHFKKIYKALKKKWKSLRLVRKLRISYYLPQSSPDHNAVRFLLTCAGHLGSRRESRDAGPLQCWKNSVAAIFFKVPHCKYFHNRCHHWSRTDI